MSRITFSGHEHSTPSERAERKHLVQKKIHHSNILSLYVYHMRHKSYPIAKIFHTERRTRHDSGKIHGGYKTLVLCYVLVSGNLASSDNTLRKCYISQRHKYEVSKVLGPSRVLIAAINVETTIVTKRNAATYRYGAP